MRRVCSDCKKLVASYIHTEYDSEGHGIRPVRPVCDACAGIYRAIVEDWPTPAA